MRKFINGKYVQVEAKPAARAADKKPTTPAGEVTPSAAAGGAPVKQDISKAALTLMAQQHPGLDWTGLQGTGLKGQVTVPDVKKFLQTPPVK